jgi:hypothetical protein
LAGLNQIHGIARVAFFEDKGSLGMTFFVQAAGDQMQVIVGEVIEERDASEDVFW